jgi:hypothetical protein
MQSSAFALKRMAGPAATSEASMAEVGEELAGRRDWIATCIEAARANGDPAGDHLAKHLVTLSEVRARLPRACTPRPCLN